MSIKKRNIHIIYLIFVIFILIRCESTQKKEYKNSIAKKNTSKATIISKNNIDKEEAYEIFFRFKKPVNCFEIEISSDIPIDEFTKKTKKIKTYFIVEKIINIKQFKKNNKNFAYSEIARNFDNIWKREQVITICSVKNDPIQKIDAKSIFRIRFTTFQLRNFSYSININSNSEIIFYKNIP